MDSSSTWHTAHGMPLFSWTPYTSVTPCCSSDSSPRDRPVQHAVCYLVIAEICALLQEVPRTQHIQASRHSRQKELQFSTVIWLKELSHHNSYSFRPGFWHVLRGLVDGSEPEATSGLPASDSCANCEHCERSDAHEVGPARRTWDPCQVVWQEHVRVSFTAFCQQGLQDLGSIRIILFMSSLHRKRRSAAGTASCLDSNLQLLFWRGEIVILQ